MNNTGGPAFPTARISINGVDEQDGIQAFSGGMTLRDYFAAKAMQGLIAADTGFTMPASKIAELAYDQANQMIAARES